MYIDNIGRRGRPKRAAENVKDLLRLTIASVEITATRREALDSVVDTDRLPVALRDHRHAVYETGTVYEFSQLARADFEAHGNASLWERPLYDPETGGVRNIDMSLFRTVELRKIVPHHRNGRTEVPVETRIEFGKLGGELVEDYDDADDRLELWIAGESKLASDATKLDRLTSRHDPSSRALGEVSARFIENLVILWVELDSRRAGDRAKLTGRRASAWAQAATRHAHSTSGSTGVDITMEAAASTALSSYRRAHHRTAHAAVFSLPITNPNNDAVIADAVDDGS